MTPQEMLASLKALQQVDHLQVVQEAALRASTSAAAAARRTQRSVGYRVVKTDSQVLVRMTPGAKPAFLKAMSREQDRIDREMTEQIRRAT